MGLMVPMITRGALGRNDLLNNYGTTNFVQPPINDLTSLMMRGSMGSGMMGGLGGAMMGGMADPVGGIMGAAANPVGAVMGGMGSPVGGMGGSMINQSSVGGFVAGAAVGAVAMNAMQNGGLNGANSIDHPSRGNQPQNSYNNGGGYNNQPQNNYNNGDGYNNQPQNNYNNGGGYNNQPQNNYNNGGGYNNQPQNNYNNGGGYNNQPQNNYNNGGGYNNQPQNNYNNGGGYNNQPQNSYNNGGGYNNQPQNNYNNGGGYNNQPQRNSDPLGDIFNQPSQPQRNVQPNPSQMGQNALEPVRNSPNSGNTNFGVQHPVSTAPAAYASNPQQAQPVVRRNRVEPTGDRLAKGQKYSIKDRDGRPATQLKICLGWDIKDGRCELDASAFMLADNGKVVGDEWFIFYGQPDSPDNGVHYKVYKDDPNSPDDAAIVLDLTRVDQRVQKIALAVTIYEASQHALNFGMVQNLYARILDSRTNREIACFRMDECYSSVTAMVLGELYRYKGEWKFNAVGSGVNQDLAQFCGMYGVALE
ncbi:TerD family protein [Ruminococcus sp.]|uniref:TerD family protein n=1 Tax=Ruminococcus sp. TaxID=41978 RepID=UPI001B104D3C|nr:TerD family protein [Ruminococcus sp.]MBO5557956.1 TerD family protein [Ruminococcus sp.]